MLSLLLAVAALSATADAPQYQGVLLEFSATWCGPCQQVKPIVERLAQQGYPIRKIDVDRDKALAAKYRIEGIPAFVLVINGKEVSRSSGYHSENQLKQLMAKIPVVTEQPETTVAEERPKRSLLPRIKLPLFNSDPKPEQQAALGDSRAIFRGTPPEEPRRPIAGVDPMAASARIRIKDAKGMNYGSGTIIDSRPGRTTLITCGHIFRNLADDALIEVDLFRGERHATYVGKVLRYDLEADVGLIEIPSDLPLAHANLAAVDTPVRPDDSVYSIGCGGGDEPTRQDIRVARLNPYLGPDNLECTGVPIQGRSGGGLFNEKGEVIGICIAADPKRESGLYAGLKAIHALLNQDEQRQPLPAVEGRLANNDGHSDGHSPAASPAQLGSEMQANAAVAFESRPAEAAINSRASEVAALDEAFSTPASPLSNLPDGAEVICIVRSHDNPRETSRVVIINRASSKFMSYLRGELDEQPQPTVARREAVENISLATSRTANFIDKHAAPAADAPRWKAAQPTPILAGNSPAQRYRRTTASRN